MSVPTLKEAVHTPGPWRAVRHNADKPGLGWLIEGEINTLIGRVHDAVEELSPYDYIPVRSGQTDANARLVAAAPDLLAALERAIPEIAAVSVPELLEQARAAIAKARGR